MLSIKAGIVVLVLAIASMVIGVQGSLSFAGSARVFVVEFSAGAVSFDLVSWPGQPRPKEAVYRLRFDYSSTFLRMNQPFAEKLRERSWPHVEHANEVFLGSIAVGWPAISHSILVIPIWPYLMLVVAYQFRLARRRRQRDTWILAGKCGSCGYDMRGSSSRCPECGAEPGRSSAT